jgi:rRNA pseudouridine-1189 N-methylase Emg1 (Nep1/Mra1 family)
MASYATLFKSSLFGHFQLQVELTLKQRVTRTHIEAKGDEIIKIRPKNVLPKNYSVFV